MSDNTRTYSIQGRDIPVSKILILIAVVLFAFGAYSADPHALSNPMFDVCLGLLASAIAKLV